MNYIMFYLPIHPFDMWHKSVTRGVHNLTILMDRRARTFTPLYSE